MTLQVPYKGPEATIALPGAWDVCVKLLQTVDNQHAVCSLPKSCLYEILHQLSREGYTCRDIVGSWVGDITSAGVQQRVLTTGGEGYIAHAVYGDDLINERTVRAVVARGVPLFAVISPDPERPYHLGGIDYEYDAENRVYRGHPAGRGDAFMYAPSPFAKYYEYQGPGYSMKTIINVFGERVVLFTD